ncbi:hypothetical protein AYO21_10188 [Fonsecaea monophora]|uniref:Uncharacterized protein n=1 Tax=Fonsecaea monophora TaxID=254056 RepID=A0A177EUL0_9EURO|nr:hypothetical protein AYO21_10188 [Fonsecaea monophora]KAH0829879.1 hypothetical protein FOPE_10892 [Fonsecaea pedrosoi]OAG35648.1 hypothetical protein AYO21_10188 [Fonsecaea monophora]
MDEQPVPSGLSRPESKNPTPERNITLKPLPLPDRKKKKTKAAPQPQRDGKAGPEKSKNGTGRSTRAVLSSGIRKAASRRVVLASYSMITRAKRRSLPLGYKHSNL